MREYGKVVRKLLKENNCHFVRQGKGDHEIWYSPITKRTITVDGKIYPRHTANGILKDAGIEYRFR